MEGKVRNSYTTEVSYISLQRTVEQARKIARGLGNTIDKKLKRYYKHLDSVFDSLNLQVKDQDRIAKKENREIERYYLDRNIPALQGLKDCVHDIFLEVSMQFGVDDSYRNKDYDAELEALELQEEFWTAMLLSLIHISLAHNFYLVFLPDVSWHPVSFYRQTLFLMAISSLAVSWSQP